MTITVNENSYVTVAEADAYYLERYGYDQWDGQTPEQKEAALISAASYMDSLCEWCGSPVDPAQKMAFPRSGCSPSADPVPEGIKIAQMEIAYGMVVSGSAGDGGSISDVLTRLKAGDVELEWKGAVNPTSSLTSDYTKSLLRTYGTCSFAGAKSRVVDVWRA
jgi:hypothetical protein